MSILQPIPGDANAVIPGLLIAQDKAVNKISTQASDSALRLHTNAILGIYTRAARTRRALNSSSGRTAEPTSCRQCMAIRKVEDGDTTSQATHHHARYCLSPMGTWDFAHRLQPSCIGVGGAAERVNISKRNLVSGTCYYTKTETYSGPHWTLYQTPCAIETIGTKHQTPRTSVQRGAGVCEPGSRCLSSE